MAKNTRLVRIDKELDSLIRDLKKDWDEPDLTSTSRRLARKVKSMKNKRGFRFDPF